MKNLSKSHLFNIVLALGFSFALTIFAFSEPTLLPGEMSANSYDNAVPIHIGDEPQIHQGKLTVGDGTNTIALPTGVDFRTKSLGVDSFKVKENANFVGDVEVGGRMLVAGALYVPQLSVTADSSKSPTANVSVDTFKLYLPPGTTTDLGEGAICTTEAYEACPMGSTIKKYYFSKVGANDAGVSLCKFISPNTVVGNYGKCPRVSLQGISVGTPNTNTCRVDMTFEQTGVDKRQARWYFRDVGTNNWKLIASSGDTYVLSVKVTNSNPQKVGEIMVTRDGLPQIQQILDVSSVLEPNSSCS